MSWRNAVKTAAAAVATGSAYFQLKLGRNVFRPLPTAGWTPATADSVEAPIRLIMKHREVGPKNRIVSCGKVINPESGTGVPEGDCYICDQVIPAFRASGNEKQIARAAEMEATPWVLMQVSPVVNGVHQMPMVYEFSLGGARSFGSKLLTFLTREDKQVEHPIKGFNMVVEKAGDGTKRGTSYPIVELESESSKVPRAVIDGIKTWHEISREYDIEEQKAALKGIDYQRAKQEADGWEVPEPAGYDEAAEADEWAEQAEAETGDESEQWEQAVEEQAVEGWEESGEATPEAVAEDGWGDDSQAAEGWDDEPTPAPAPMVKKAPAPMMVKKAPAPMVKKAPMMVKKAPMMVKKAPAPAPAPAPMVKKAPAPMVKKAPAPMVKKQQR